MIFASWTFDGLFLDINVNSNEGDITNYIKNGEWHLVKLLAIKNLKKYSCCEEPYPEIVYKLVIRRRPLYYLFNMVFPCFLITMVAFLGFYLPPGSTEKVSIGITTLLSITVFLMLVAESMPPTSEQLPLLGIYYAVTIGIVSCSTAMAVFTLNINNKGHNGTRVPKIIKILFLVYLAKILRTKLNIKKEKKNSTKETKKETDLHSPLIAFNKKLIANHLINSKETAIISDQNQNDLIEYNSNNDESVLNTNSSRKSSQIETKEFKLNNKIDKLILEASDDVLYSNSNNNNYNTQIDLIDSDDNFVYYLNLNNDNRSLNQSNNENKLIARQLNSFDISKQCLNRQGSENKSSTNNNNNNTNNNVMSFQPGTPICQLHCICECSNNSTSLHDSFKAHYSNSFKHHNNNNNNLLQFNSISKSGNKQTDFKYHHHNNNNKNQDILESPKKSINLRKRNSPVFVASNPSPKSLNLNKKIICPQNLNDSFINELKYILENQFNPLVETIMNVVEMNEKRLEETQRLEDIQNEWSNVAKVADHFLCYFFPITTIAICLLIFLNSPHAFTQW